MEGLRGEDTVAEQKAGHQALTKQIITLDTGESVSQAKTGAEIVAMLEAIEPIEFVDPHIEDPVERVKAHRCNAQA